MMYGVVTALRHDALQQQRKDYTDAGFVAHLCRERRLVAVQTTYGVLLPPDMMHSSSDMSTTLMLSDAHISTSMGSGSLEFASEFPANAESDAQALMFGSYEEEAGQVRSLSCISPRVVQDLHAHV